MTTVAATTYPTTFLEYDRIRELSTSSPPSDSSVNEILNRALQLKGLSMEDAAVLININDAAQLKKLLETATRVKQEIYGKRIVLFAPLYAGNYCSNNCLYCGFRKDNHDLKRVRLTMDEIAAETESLLREGHKRLLLLTGESKAHGLEYTSEAIKTIYNVKVDGANIRRINVEIAPMDVSDFKILKKTNIGTYTCFQETYDPILYREYHPTGPKADYAYRLYVMDRAMEGGIDDVGIGALFGLADYRFEVLAMLQHAAHLEKTFGCGPHTVSVPRIEPASGAPLSQNIPFKVSDDDFRKIVAVIRVSLPYTGIILSTREDAELRSELFHFGVSQVSAGSRTDPGGYAKQESNRKDGQFSLGDHRTLEQVISVLIADGYIPSFCTGCYRKGRVGNDFMDLAKPGLIQQYCMPNGLFSFAEYLIDYASEDTRQKGFALIDSLTEAEALPHLRKVIRDFIGRITAGERDLYL